MTSTVATLTRPEAAFHGVVGNLVDLLDPVSEADPIALVVETLASFGSMVDRRTSASGASFRAPTCSWALLEVRRRGARARLRAT
jgi:hypothetical protein